MSNHRAEKSGFAREAQMKPLDMARSLSDEELQNVVDTKGSRKKQHANKRASVAEDIGDHSTDSCDEKGKEIIDLVSRQNVDVKGKKSVNIDGEVVNSEFAHIVEGIPTERDVDKTDVQTRHSRPVEKLICNDMESGVKVNDKEEDPSLNNEEYEGDKRAGLTSFDHNESNHQLVAIVEWYSLSSNQILWMHSQLEVKSYWLNGQFMTTRSWVLMIGIEYPGSFFKYVVQKNVLDVSTCSTSSRGTILDLNPDVPCEFMPNSQQREFKHHSCQEAVTQNSGILDDSALSNSQRREVAQVLRLGACRPFSAIAQETVTREIDNLPAPALPAIISSRSSEGQSQRTGCGMLDASRTPGIFNIRKFYHYTQKEVTALKEEAERNSGGGNQAPENNEAAPAVPSEEDSDVIAVSGIKKREVTYCGKKWMIPISEPISDRKMGLKWCLNVSQNHPCFQNNEIPVFVIPLLPRQTYIEFQGAVPVSDDGDQITFESEADTYASRLLGYTTDPLTIIDQTAFEIDNLRLGGPVSLIEQDTEQQTTCIHPLRTAQNESLVDEEQSPSETGSTSRELCSLSDTHGTPELCHIRMADHNHSSPQLTCTGTQNDVDALKEPKEVNATKNPITVSAHDETNEESATMYPAYKDNHTRRVSFKESSNNVQNTTKMADCGFFYAGFGDCVCCFHCGVELQHWQGEDDPWIEHVRYSPECRYVRMMKGDKFISLVKMAVKREEAERNSGGGNRAPENNEAAPAVFSEEGHKTTGNTKSEQSQKDPQKIKREHRELRDVTLCKICMENTISVVFLPCGHLVTCSDCAPTMRKCPICRTLIKGTVKTFYG